MRPDNGQPDMREQMEAQQEAQTQQEMVGQARQMGQGTANLQDLIDQDDLLDQLLDYDIDRGEGDDLEENMKTEFSRLYMTSNLSEQEVKKMQIWSDQEAHLKSLEHPDARSLAAGPRGQIMYGTASPAELSAADLDGQSEQALRPKAPLTDEQERRVWSAADAKKAGLTRSKNGWLVRMFREFVAVGVTEKRTKDDDGGGLLSGIKDRLI